MPDRLRAGDSVDRRESLAPGPQGSPCYGGSGIGGGSAVGAAGAGRCHVGRGASWPSAGSRSPWTPRPSRTTPPGPRPGCQRAAPADPHRDARRLDRGGLRRAARPRHPGGADRDRHLRRPPAGRSTSRTSRSSAPSRRTCPPSSTRSAAPAVELAIIMIGANDVTELTKPAVAVPFLEDAVRRLRERRRRGGGRHLPGPRHDPADRPAAARLRPSAVAPDGARPDRGGGGGRRPDGVAGRHARPDVRHPAGDVLGRPVPPVRGGLRTRRRWRCCRRRWTRSACGTRARSASTFTTRRSKPLEKAAAQAAARPGSEVAPSRVATAHAIATHGPATGPGCGGGGRRDAGRRCRPRRPCRSTADTGDLTHHSGGTIEGTTRNRHEES